MSRNITSNTKALLSRQVINTAFVECLKITVDGDPESPWLYSNNTIDVEYVGPGAYVSLTGTYEAFPFNIVIPATVETEPPNAVIQFDNVSKELVDELRSFTTPPTLEYFLVRGSGTTYDFGTPYIEISGIEPDIYLTSLKLKNVKVSQNIIEMQFGYEDTLSARFPNEGFTPNLFPGLF